MKKKNIMFCDASSVGDGQLRVLSRLLINSRESLEEAELIEIGVFLQDYLNDKCLLEHVFWGRSLSSCGFSPRQIALKIQLLKLIS